MSALVLAAIALLPWQHRSDAGSPSAGTEEMPKLFHQIDHRYLNFSEIFAIEEIPGQTEADGILRLHFDHAPNAVDLSGEDRKQFLEALERWRPPASRRSPSNSVSNPVARRRRSRDY
jgi:hypothetical protein